MSDLPSIDLSETESVKSDTNSIKSTASSIVKPSGIKQPTVTARIGRPCCAGHLPKPGLPPPPEPKNNNMRRQSDDYSRSHLSDVFEESEADLMSERLPRSVKSKSPDSFSSKTPKSDRKISNGSTNSDLYMEATGRRHSSDQGTILTTDTDSFIIGQRIWVGGIRPGLIAYIGETHFAPGEWAGVVLDDPNGKNDGCVAGKRYFQCEPKRGIFSRLTRLTREPLPGGVTSTSDLSMNMSSRSMTSPSRSGTVSPTQSMKSFSGNTPSKSNLAVGDRVIVSSGMGSRVGVLQYIGETKFAPCNWCGVQLDDASGKNDGSVDGVKYFDCPAHYGVFVPLAKVSLSPSSRKPRLSRSGSKESLTSVGTMGSIASTATSRLRMSAQRLSSTAKPITTPKNTFSLQEVLREKQNHIEHLLIERDLDRQDSENNTMMYQKTINQLKETISSLEKQLTSEKQKSEDLQTSIDEASFCTDELNVLTQEYKDRVAVLEAQVSGKEPPDGKASFEESKRNEEISRLQKQIELLTTNLVEKQSEIQGLEQSNSTLTSEMALNFEAQKATINEFTAKVTALESSEKCLQEQLQDLTRQNDKIQAELRLEVEAKERECLQLKQTENELRAEADVLKNEIKLRESAMAGCDSEMQKLIEAKDTIIAEHNEAAVGSEHLHIMIVKQKEEEITQATNTIHELRKLNESLSADKSNLLQEIENNSSRIDSLQTKVDESSKLSAQFENDSTVNLKLIEDLKQRIEQHESTIKTFESKVGELSSINTELEGKVTELLAMNANVSAVLEKASISESDLRQQLQISIESSAQLEKVKLEQQEVLVNRDKCIEEQQKIISDLQSKFGEMTTKNEALQKELSDFRFNAENTDEAFTKLSAELKSSTNELNEKRSELEASQRSLSMATEESKVLSEQISVFTNEIAHLKASLDASLSSVADLGAKVTSLEDAHRSDMQAADTWTKEVQNLNGQIDVLTKNNSTLNEDLKHAQSALESTKLENERSLNLTKELSQQIDSLQNTLTTKNEEIDNIQKANNDLQANLKTSVQSGNEVQDKLSKLEVEYADLSRKRALLDEKCEQLLLEKSSLQQNVDALQNSSSDTNSEVHRLSAELQQKQKSYEELVDKTNSIQLSLEKRLHEITQNLDARTTQWEGVKNEMESLKMQKIERENELNLELSKMKEAAVEEKRSLVEVIDGMKLSHQEEKERLLKEIDGKLKDSEESRSELNLSIANLEKTVGELQKEVEKSKNEILEKEQQFESKIKIMQSIEEDLKRQLDESNRKELELRNSFDIVTKSGAEGVEQLTKELNEKENYSKNLQSQIEQLQVTYDKATVENIELKANLLAEEKKNEELANAFAKEKENFNEIKSKMEQELVLALSKFKSTEDDQVDLVNRNLELVQQNEQLTREIAESNSRNNETNNQLSKLLSEFEAFKLSEELVKKDIESKVAESLENEAAGSVKIKMLESQNVQLEIEVGNKEKEIEIIYSSLREAQHEYETLNTEAATLNESTQAQINSQQHEVAEQIKTIRLLEDKIVQLTSSVNLSDDLKNELNHKSAEIKSKDTNILELSNAVDALKEQVNAKEMDLKRLLEEKEAEGKRSMDAIDRKNEEIKCIDLQLMTAKKTLEDKSAEFEQMSNELSVLSSAKSSLTQEISRLNDQIKNYNENFVDRTELINLKEEFSMYEEIKGNEIVDLTKKLLEVEDRMKSQSAGVDKLEMLERQKKEISYEKTALERREAQLVLENKQLADKLLQMKASSTPSMPIVSDNESGAQISFLNSIIADMQRKNETLTYRIQALESAPSDFVNNGLFDLPVKRQPAPRLFCDICDEFDAHETEDCPLQSSDSPPPPINVPEMTSTVKLMAKDAAKERKLPPPRKYCESCEAFGHDSSECDNEETF